MFNAKNTSVIVDLLGTNPCDRRNLYEIFTRAFLDFAIPRLETFKWTLYLSVVCSF